MALKTSAFFDLSTTPSEGRSLSCTLDEMARQAAAERLGALAVLELSGEGRVRPADGGLLLSATLHAKLERRCVVSLAPMEELIDEMFSIRFVPDAQMDPADQDRVADPDVAVLTDPDSPDVEPMGDSPISFCDLLIEQTALAMTPYPRRPDAAIDPTIASPRGAISPFSGLRDALAETPNEGETATDD